MNKTGKPTAAGILTIVAGGMGIGVGAYVIAFREMITDLVMMYGVVSLAELGEFFAVFSGVAIALGTIALIGGICALKRRCWGMALAGAICSLPMIPIGTPLGILVVVFVSKGKKEFS